MSGYVDLRHEAEMALELRRARRRRLISGIRGWLRQHHHPHWLGFALFLLCVPVGVAVAAAARGCGIESWGMAPAAGVFAMWPVFVGLAGFACSRLARSDEYLDEMGFYAAHDESAEATESERFFGDGTCDDEMQRGIGAGLRSGSQQGGSAALPVMLLLACVTLGGWLVWQIVRKCPTLFAETILDGSLARKIPSLEDRVAVQSWRANAFAGTAIYFLGLALIVFLTGALLYASQGYWRR